MAKVEKTYLGHTGIAQPCGNPLKHAYGVIGPRRWRDQIKIRSVKVRVGHLNDKNMWGAKTTYQERIHTVQPPANSSKCPYGVVGLSHQCGGLKIKPIKVRIEHINNKIVQEGEATHLGPMHIAQPLIRHPNCPYRLITQCCWCGKLKVEPRNISIAQENGMAYHRCAQAMQPCGNPSKGCWEVHRTRCRCGHIKFTPRNISQTQMNRNAYLGHIIMIWPTWRPKKDVRRLDGLTFESRMLGELWHNVDGYGWASARVAISARIWAQCDLANWVTMWMSRKTDKPSHQQVSYSIRVGHIHLEQHFIGYS